MICSETIITRFTEFKVMYLLATVALIFQNRNIMTTENNMEYDNSVPAQLSQMCCKV